MGVRSKWLDYSPIPLVRAPYPIHGACDVTVMGRKGSNFGLIKYAAVFRFQSMRMEPRRQNERVAHNGLANWKREKIDVVGGSSNASEEFPNFEITARKIGDDLSILATPAECLLYSAHDGRWALRYSVIFYDGRWVYSLEAHFPSRGCRIHLSRGDR